MEEKIAEKWLKQFNDNYYGRTTQAKELEKYIKDGFQGGTYIPWAVMQRMIYQQDPNAEFTILENSEGGTVWEDYGFTETKDSQAVKEGYLEINTAYSWSNKFVKVKCTFLGKTVIEHYPVQGQVGKVFNGAPKTIDQNMVNKALQRAKAKAAAIVSGLALGLYENGDLQFEPEEQNDDSKTKTKKPEVVVIEKKKQTTKVEEPKVEEPKVEEKSSPANDVSQDFVYYANYMISNKDRLLNTIKELNVSVSSAYGFVIDLDAGIDALVEILSKVKNGHQFFRAILNKSGYKLDEIEKVLDGGSK